MSAPRQPTSPWASTPTASSNVRLGIWVQADQGAKFWASVCAELANRGVRDGAAIRRAVRRAQPASRRRSPRTGLEATVQTCVVHLIRAAMRFVNYKDRKDDGRGVAADLHRRGRGLGVDRAGGVRDDPVGKKYPSAIKAFRDAWERFTPFLAFPPALRKVIYTTNSISR